MLPQNLFGLVASGLHLFFSDEIKVLLNSPKRKRKKESKGSSATDFKCIQEKSSRRLGKEKGQLLGSLPL